MTNGLAILQVVFGLGLVVFVHELGHFIAARLCKVDVRIFSLGFGPPLISFVRGGTRYQIALVPIGGFVAMAGEHPGERKGPAQPGDVLAKSVGQRFFIYSAGVLMNLLFAVVLLPVLFWVGVPFTRPMFGEPTPGGPAWKAGLVAGTEVLEVGGTRVFDFGQITSEVALADAGAIELLVKEPGASSPRIVAVEAEQGPDGFRELDVAAPLDPEQRLYVAPDGIAARSGLSNDDRLRGVVGQPAELSVVRQLARAVTPDRDLEIVVANASGEERRVALDLEWAPGLGAPLIGVAPLANRVVAVRGGGPFAALVDSLGSSEEKVRLVTARGQAIGDADDLLDTLLGDASGATTLVRVNGTTVDATAAFEEHVTSRGSAVLAANDIALSNDLSTSFVRPRVGDAAAEAGLAIGDRVVSIGGVAVASWDDLIAAVRTSVDRGGPIALVCERRTADGVTEETFSVTPRPSAWADIGFELGSARYVHRTTSPSEALSAGLASARKNFEDVWLALRRIATAEISSRNIGGVISMSVISYHTAKEGPSKLLFFLCILSINLAVINVLPVPVLDGGHLLFLIVEKLKGAPVSERVLGYSQMVGFVMIVSLVVYVTWNDLQRWVLG
jgi:regulator of sigma E protease